MTKHRRSIPNLAKLDFVENKPTGFFATEYIQNSFGNRRRSTVFEQPKPETIEIAKAKGNKKGSIFYLAHSYPTKVPVEDIIGFILKNTKPGDVVLDPFCGSGMTALAAQLTGRHAVVSDIGTLALHLAYNHTRTCDVKALREAASSLLSEVELEGSEYSLVLEGQRCEINYVVHSEFYRCDSCRKQNSAWEMVHSPKGKAGARCSNCGGDLKESGQTNVGSKPVQLAYWIEGAKSLTTAAVTPSVLRAIEKRAPSKNVQIPVADTRISTNREMYIRCALHLKKIDKLSDFYTDRNLNALSRLYTKIMAVADLRVRAALMFAFTNTAWHASRLRRYNAKGGHRPLTGTLYVPQLYSEGNVYRIFGNKI